MYLVLLSTIILSQPLGSSFLPSIEGILILLAASGPPLPLTTMLLLLLHWLRHNGGERRALPNSLDKYKHYYVNYSGRYVVFSLNYYVAKAARQRVYEKFLKRPRTFAALLNRA